MRLFRTITLGALVAALLSTTSPAHAGVTNHTETCTETTVTLSGFPSRGVHTVTAYFGGAQLGNQSKTFTGTSATLKFAVSVEPGESYSVMYSWKGSQGGTKPGIYIFECVA